tara:strand:- start:167 stop:577 length:411 start_codon:yes stop_codon:yes gene_type:complete
MSRIYVNDAPHYLAFEVDAKDYELVKASEDSASYPVVKVNVINEKLCKHLKGCYAVVYNRKVVYYGKFSDSVMRRYFRGNKLIHAKMRAAVMHKGYESFKVYVIKEKHMPKVEPNNAGFEEDVLRNIDFELNVMGN